MPNPFHFIRTAEGNVIPTAEGHLAEAGQKAGKAAVKGVRIGVEPVDTKAIGKALKDAEASDE